MKSIDVYVMQKEDKRIRERKVVIGMFTSGVKGYTH